MLYGNCYTYAQHDIYPFSLMRTEYTNFNSNEKTNN